MFGVADFESAFAQADAPPLRAALLSFVLDDYRQVLKLVS
jgi:hypothetical protein